MEIALDKCSTGVLHCVFSVVTLGLVLAQICPIISFALLGSSPQYRPNNMQLRKTCSNEIITLKSSSAAVRPCLDEHLPQSPGHFSWSAAFSCSRCELNLLWCKTWEDFRSANWWEVCSVLLCAVSFPTAANQMVHGECSCGATLPPTQQHRGERIIAPPSASSTTAVPNPVGWKIVLSFYFHHTQKKTLFS